MLIGYARASAKERNLALQLDALKAAGCEVICKDRGTGKGLVSALARCGVGDVLVVWNLSRLRLDRPLDLGEMLDNLRARGAGLRVLTDAGAPLDTTGPEGPSIFRVFAAFAEFEREWHSERTRKGMKSARKRGAHIGRPPKLTPAQIETAARLLAAGRSQRKVAGSLGVALSTLRDALKRQRALDGAARS